MPWMERSVMEERLQFVARRLAGEPMAELCREFGVTRKTGYKIFDPYQECGVHGLTDRSRRPYRYAHQLPFQVANYILNVKRKQPSWVRAKSASAWCGDSPASRSRQKHRSCRARSLRPGGAPRPCAAACAGRRFIAGPAVQTASVHGLQRRVPARQIVSTVTR